MTTLDDLPTEIIILIGFYLPSNEKFKLVEVNKYWEHSLNTSEYFWKTTFVEERKKKPKIMYKVEKDICTRNKVLFWKKKLLKLISHPKFCKKKGQNCIISKNGRNVKSSHKTGNWSTITTDKPIIDGKYLFVLKIIRNAYCVAFGITPKLIPPAYFTTDVSILGFSLFIYKDGSMGSYNFEGYDYLNLTVTGRKVKLNDKIGIFLDADRVNASFFINDVVVLRRKKFLLHADTIKELRKNGKNIEEIDQYDEIWKKKKYTYSCNNSRVSQTFPENHYLSISVWKNDEVELIHFKELEENVNEKTAKKMIKNILEDERKKEREEMKERRIKLNSNVVKDEKKLDE